MRNFLDISKLVGTIAGTYRTFQNPKGRWQMGLFRSIQDADCHEACPPSVIVSFPSVVPVGDAMFLLHMQSSRRTRFGLFFVLVALLVSFVNPSWAVTDPIVLAINPLSLSTAPSGKVDFTGTITNLTGGALNATDLFFGFSSFDFNVLTADQLLGVPDFTLPNNTISGKLNLFDVMVAPTAATGTYPMDVLLEDINGNLSNILTVNVVVAASAAPAPEPATLSLVVLGIASIGVARLFVTRGDDLAGCERQG